MQEIEQSSGLSRRTLVAGVAWGVPAVMAVSAVPAFATSTTVTQVSVSSVGSSSGNTNAITVTFHTLDGTAVKAGTLAEITVDITQVATSTPTYGISTATTNCTIVSTTPATRKTVGTIVVVVRLSNDGSGTGQATTTASFTVIEWKNGTAGTAQATGGTAASNNGSVSPTGSALNIPS